MTAIGAVVDLVVVEPLEDPVPPKPRAEDAAMAECDAASVVEPANEPVPA